MFFRVKFSTDVDEYYKDNATDVQFALTVGASTFDNAILTAKNMLDTYCMWPRIFEVVSVQKIDI